MKYRRSAFVRCECSATTHDEPCTRFADQESPGIVSYSLPNGAPICARCASHPRNEARADSLPGPGPLHTQEVA